jgi:hypothetical protein
MLTCRSRRCLLKLKAKFTLTSQHFGVYCDSHTLTRRSLMLDLSPSWTMSEHTKNIREIRHYCYTTRPQSHSWAENAGKKWNPSYSVSPDIPSCPCFEMSYRPIILIRVYTRTITIRSNISHLSFMTKPLSIHHPIATYGDPSQRPCWTRDRAPQGVRHHCCIAIHDAAHSAALSPAVKKKPVHPVPPPTVTANKKRRRFNHFLFLSLATRGHHPSCSYSHSHAACVLPSHQTGLNSFCL